MVQNTDIAIVRSLRVTREAVWRAWTEPRELALWWWPARFGTQYEMDLRVGGPYRYITAEIPKMGVLELSGTFLSVEPPHALKYTWQWAGDANISRVTVTFSDASGATEIEVRHAGLPTPEERENHIVGWNDCLDRLEALIDGASRGRGSP